MAKSVDDYVAGLTGWQAETAQTLRRALRAGGVTEVFKWGHPVYEAGGPVALFKAHKAHMTLGFWRGADMTGLDPRLEPGGSFSMASIKLTEEGQITESQVAALLSAGVELNRQKGDPLKDPKA